MRRTSGWAPEEFDRLVAIETDECVAWPYTKRRGYGVIKDAGVARDTHVLALERRVGPRPPGMDAAHGPCNNKACMNYRHLRWKTRKENLADRHRDGTFTQAKLTQEAVRDIRRSTATPAALSEKYGVSEGSIRNVRARRTWKNVD